MLGMGAGLSQGICPGPCLSPQAVLKHQHRPTFDLLHLILKGHRAPSLGGASTVGGRVVIRRVVLEQHHVWS